MCQHTTEIIEHNLPCKCHRRREWINVNGKMTPIEFSTHPDAPPMSEEEKEKISMIIQTYHDSKKTKSTDQH